MSIRPAQERDVPRMGQIYAPYVEQTTYSFEEIPPDHEIFLRRFREHTDQFPWLVWEEDGVVRAEISVYLEPDAHGRGIGRALYQRLEELLKRQGYRVVYALVTTENHGSAAFHEAMGYTKRTTFENCGYKFGRWLGVIWYEKWLNPLTPPLSPPTPWRKL